MSLPHDSAHLHVTGQSEFIDDRPSFQNEIFLEVVWSPHAHAQIVRINSDDAMKTPGVLAVFTASDFQHNRWGTIFKDQPLLADGEVNFVGEAVAVVAATHRESAAQGKAKVKVEYRTQSSILSIRDAIANRSFIAGVRKIERGNVEEAFQTAPHQIRGRIVIRGADHFYLESQAAVAYPQEEGRIEVHSSSQHSTETQHVVAHALGLDYKDVVCIVKRMGGAFGGKESQAAPFAAYAALAAQKLKRPSRIILSKDDDMIMTGKRNPFENEYQVAFDSSGLILGLIVELYSDGGAYADLSTSIMERAMLHCDNAYFIPNMKVTGQVCRTHFHPHTAFRGFGGPKGVATIELILEKIAAQLGLDPLDVRKLNCYEVDGPRSITHYGQTVENNCLPQLFNQLEESCHYRKRRKEIQQHNKSVLRGGSSEPLRGLSLTSVKFGISFTTRFLNQANALVLVHRDGSVQVSTGATEMGQGANARIAELVATELGIPRHQVRMMPTSTDKNANTSPTAASTGTDLNGAAAVLAARKIKARLSELALRLFEIPESRWARHTAGLGTEPEIHVNDLPLEMENPNQGADWPTGVATYHGMTFQDGCVFSSSPEASPSTMSFATLVNEAYHSRISLSDYAFYRFPGLSFNKLTGQGNAFLYFTQGTAASEVTVDRFTGDVKVQRVDILMDLGRPINRDLDLGQVTGGFIQGMGWVTTEKLFYNSDGALLSHAPSTYKIPNIQDTPRVFNVELLPNEANFKTIRGTKAVGEPPLLLAMSVWTAIHDAIKDARSDNKAFPLLEIPATSEEVLRALTPDQFKFFENL